MYWSRDNRKGRLPNILLALLRSYYRRNKWRKWGILSLWARHWSRKTHRISTTWSILALRFHIPWNPKFFNWYLADASFPPFPYFLFGLLIATRAFDSWLIFWPWLRTSGMEFCKTEIWRPTIWLVIVSLHIVLIIEIHLVIINSLFNFP